MNRPSLAVALTLLTSAAFASLLPAPGLAEEYLPLPLGATWHYVGDAGGGETLVVTGTRVLFGTETQVVSYENSTMNDGLENYWTTAPDGDVFLWGFFRNLQGWGWAYYPPLRMVDAPLSPGQQWSTTTTLYDLPELVPQSTFDYPLEVYTEGTITVPAGSFFAYGIGPATPLPIFGYTVAGEVITADIRDRTASDWWSDGVGRVQYVVDQTYALTSFEMPTPIVPTSWGRVKALYQR